MPLDTTSNLTWQGATVMPPPGPPVQLWPANYMAEFVVDCWRVMLADPDNNVIGIPAPIPLMRKAQTSRTAGRDL